MVIIHIAVFTLGFSRQTMDSLANWKHLWGLSANLILPDLPLNKVFKPKFALPTPKDYNCAFPAWFWTKAPSNFVSPAVSLVNPKKLHTLASGYVFNAPSAYDGEQVTDAICNWLTKGFAFDPVILDEVPNSAKFSGIMT